MGNHAALFNLSILDIRFGSNPLSKNTSGGTVGSIERLLPVYPEGSIPSAGAKYTKKSWANYAIS